MIYFTFSSNMVHIATNITFYFWREKWIRYQIKKDSFEFLEKNPNPENPTPKPKKPNNNSVTRISNARNEVLEREIYFRIHLE